MSEIKVPYYRLYLDEAGDHTYIDLNYVSHRYLGLMGCIFERANDYQKAADELKLLKEIFWSNPDPDRPVIFHREDMINCRGYFSIFRDANARVKFDIQLIQYLKRQKFTIINVVLDKKAHQAQYKYPINPYEYCLTAMIERYCGWLKMKNNVGDVLAESRGGREDRQLKAVYKKIYHHGTNQRSDPTFFTNVLTSCEIKIKPKITNIAGLQIADILAYPLKEKIFYERGVRKDNFLGTFNEKVFNAVKDKYNKQFFTGRVKGYGEVFI
jgi:hypothetical protein